MSPTNEKNEIRPRPQQFLYLLASLLLILIVVPLIQNHFLASLFQQAFLTAVLVSAIAANRQRRHLLLSGIVFAAFVLPLNWATLVFDTPLLSLIAYGAGIAFLSVAAAMILMSVFRDYLATIQAVFGAICVYLLIGLTWALVYSALDYADHGAFLLPEHATTIQLPHGHEITPYSQMVYFSFVTMSTLGYGDMLPHTHLAQTLTWMQSVLGQLYLAVLVARLVSILPATASGSIETEER